MGVIYKITSPTNKVYIGKTYDLRKRINCHKHAAKKKGNIILHNSIAKYGWDAHILEIVEQIDDKLLNEREIHWIEILKTYCHENPMGMNMTKGGEGQRTTWMHDIERRRKQSEARRGEKGTFYGRHHTEETKKIIAEKARKWNLENGQKVPKWGAEKGRLKVIKSVLKYDILGNFIAEYESCTEAGKSIGVTGCRVSENAQGRRSQCNGWIFKYKTENYPLKIDISYVQKQSVKRPVLWIASKTKVVEFPSPFEAAEKLNIPITSIRRAALYNKMKPLRSGHVFIYKDLYKKVS